LGIIVKNILAFLLLVAMVFGQKVSTETLAIPFFENTTQKSEYNWLNEALADMLTTDIAASQKITVVSRLNLKQIIDEQKLTLSGLVDESSAKRIGNLSGASIILSGTYTIISDEVRIDVKIFDVEQGTSKGATSVFGRVSDIFILEKKLALQVFAILNILITEEDKIKLFQIASDNIEAVENNYRGIIALDNNQNDKAKSFFQKAVSVDPYYKYAKSNLSVAEKKISGGGLFLSALSSLGKKEEQLAVITQLVNEFKRSGAEMKVKGEPEIITDSKNPNFVDIKVLLELSLNYEYRNWMFDQISDVSEGTKTWYVMDIKDNRNQVKAYRIFEENMSYLNSKAGSFKSIKYLKFLTGDETAISIPFQLYINYDSFKLRAYGLRVYDKVGRNNKFVKIKHSHKDEENEYTYIIKKVPISTIKEMTKIVISDEPG
jgi:TolB-like protein